MAKKEFLDVYDINRNKTGQVIEKGLPFPKGKYFLSTHVWIVNSNKEFLIQKRAEDKIVKPGKWSVSGGHVDLGEDSKTCAIRETLEETGIDISKDIELVFSCVDTDEWGSLVDVFLAKKDFDIKEVVMQKEEVSDVKWANM